MPEDGNRQRDTVRKLLRLLPGSSLRTIRASESPTEDGSSGHQALVAGLLAEELTALTMSAIYEETFERMLDAVAADATMLDVPLVPFWPLRGANYDRELPDHRCPVAGSHPLVEPIGLAEGPSGVTMNPW